jgi:hypothetical protein
MKFGIYFALFSSLLLLPIAAFAKTPNHMDFSLSNPTHVGSAVLKPGNYKMEWRGTTSNAKVIIQQDGKTVATSQARIVEMKYKYPHDAVEIKTAKKNNVLQGFDFHDSRQELVLKRG